MAGVNRPTTNILPSVSIRSLYPLALAEGEGVGTAYEYFAKRLVLRPWLKTLPPIRRVLVAGLPQKYGASLDYLLLAQELGAEVVIVDERPEALTKCQEALANSRAGGLLTAVTPQTHLVPNLARMEGVEGAFDLVIANEVLQRLAAADRPLYVRRQRELATAVALFCPNAANPDHAAHSGLGTLHLAELLSLTNGVAAPISGYIDMPPFPTGVIRSEAQRAQAESGRLEAAAMAGLGLFARLERFLPTAVRRQKSHIIYALME